MATRWDDKLQGLTDDRLERIIQAALQEFAEHGYAQTSTNVITRHAGIAKGLLFHYWGSKAELFLPVCLLP